MARKVGLSNSMLLAGMLEEIVRVGGKLAAPCALESVHFPRTAKPNGCPTAKIMQV